MAEDQTRIVRLSAILTHLQSKQLVTARELAEHYDVSVRTIYRDIRTLERAGIPIAVEEGRGYFLGEGFRLPPIMFTEDEALALVTVEQLLKRTQDKSLITNYKDAIIKIKSVLGNRQKANIEFVTDRLQVRTYTSESPSSHHLIELQQAIAHFRVVDIRYLSLKDEMTERTLEPFALYTTQTHWLLIAFCRVRQDFRSFRLDRIQDLKVKSETFGPHEMTLEEYFEVSRKNWTTPDSHMARVPDIFASKLTQIKMQNVQLDSFHFIGIAVKTTNAGGQAGQDLGQLWGAFLSQNLAEQIPSRRGDQVYMLFTAYEGDYTEPYTAILGCKVDHLDNVPEGMVGYSFEGGNYTKFVARGNMSEGLVFNQWVQIWNMDLERAYTVDLEEYGPEAQNPEDAEVGFYIAVK